MAGASLYMRLIVMLITLACTRANEDAKRLYDDLMVNYNRHRRPAAAPNEPVTIRLRLRLSQIIDVVRYCFNILVSMFLLVFSMNSIKR